MDTSTSKKKHFLQIITKEKLKTKSLLFLIPPFTFHSTFPTQTHLNAEREILFIWVALMPVVGNPIIYLFCVTEYRSLFCNQLSHVFKSNPHLGNTPTSFNSFLSNINFFRSNIKQAWRACIGKEQIIWIFWLKILELCILSISALSRQAWQACLVIKRWLKISELLAKLISFLSWCSYVCLQISRRRVKRWEGGVCRSQNRRCERSHKGVGHHVKTCTWEAGTNQDEKWLVQCSYNSTFLKFQKLIKKRNWFILSLQDLLVQEKLGSHQFLD